MPNSICVLRASILTPKVIAQPDRRPEEILETLIQAEDYQSEKFAALMARPEVSGFLAFKLLKKSTANAIIFNQILDLYNKRFIKRGNRHEALIDLVLSLQLWICNIVLSHDLKQAEANKALIQLRPLILGLVKHWTLYRHSAVALLDEIEYVFVEQYEGRLQFFDDPRPKYRGKTDSSEITALREYVFPFIGKTLIELAATGKYYKNSKELSALATKKYFGSPDLAGPLYVKLQESSFTLAQISQFIQKPGDAMETFLLSSDGEIAKTRFINLCQNEKPNDVFRAIKAHVSYGGFEFSSNLLYQNLSLEEKIDFLSPYSSPNMSDHNPRQVNLLRFWVKDPDWLNPEKSISDLTLLALKKSSLFTFDIRRLSDELKEVILRRENAAEIASAKIKFQHSHFFYLITSGSYIYERDYPEEFSAVGLVLATLDLLRDQCEILRISRQDNSTLMQNTRETQLKAYQQIRRLFAKHLATYLPNYSLEDGVAAVIKAEACNDKENLEILLRQKLNYSQLLSLLEKIEPSNAKRPVVVSLCQNILAELEKIASDKECLAKTVNLLLTHKSFFTISELLEPVFDRDDFSDIEKLLNTLQEIFAGPLPHGDKTEARKAIRAYIEITLSTSLDYKNEALLFCQHPFFFNDCGSWTWYFSRYPPKSLEELNHYGLSDKLLQQIFSDTKLSENLVRIWQSLPLREVPLDFVYRFILKRSHLHDHPDWAGLSLKERLGFYEPKYMEYYYNILPSIEIDFERLWQEGGWTAEMYLDELERIKPLGSDKLAHLAVEAIAKIK